MKQKTLVSVLVLSLLFSACAPPPQAQRDSKPPVPAKPAPPVKAGPTIPVAAPRVFDESLLRGKEFLLEAAPVSVSWPRDPDLGILESDSGIVNAAAEFFKGASAGKVETETLVPRWTGYLQNWILRFQKDAPDLKVIRVGKALVQEGTIMVPVRLGVGDKEFSGWVVLVREGEKLLVSDVQIVESAARTTPFDPESPQEISSPSLR